MQKLLFLHFCADQYTLLNNVPKFICIMKHRPIESNLLILSLIILLFSKVILNVCNVMYNSNFGVNGKQSVLFSMIIILSPLIFKDFYLGDF